MYSKYGLARNDVINLLTLNFVPLLASASIPLRSRFPHGKTSCRLSGYRYDGTNLLFCWFLSQKSCSNSSASIRVPYQTFPQSWTLCLLSKWQFSQVDIQELYTTLFVFCFLLFPFASWFFAHPVPAELLHVLFMGIFLFEYLLPDLAQEDPCVPVRVNCIRTIFMMWYTQISPETEMFWFLPVCGSEHDMVSVQSCRWQFSVISLFTSQISADIALFFPLYDAFTH